MKVIVYLEQTDIDNITQVFVREKSDACVEHFISVNNVRGHLSMKSAKDISDVIEITLSNYPAGALIIHKHTQQLF